MFDFKEFRENNNFTQKEIANYFGVSQAFISQIEKKIRPIPDYFISKIKADKELIKPMNIQINKQLIPFYDDVATIGGINGQSANMQEISAPSEYIDTGDWFREATAAIRHYGDSMVEYHPGSILALKEVRERRLIVWGKDYVIETSEYRLTKRVQRGINEEYIRAYSSNTETYPDGQLVHEYLDIAWKDIRRIFLVLGYVVKKNGGTIMHSSQNK
jgi:transcriptional regulator with XRE-family HTH domain